MNLCQFGQTNALSPFLQPLRNVCGQVDVWSLELVWSLVFEIRLLVFRTL